ncbi:MAG: EamA family transporter [Patescibacteria group bacterium]
MLWFLYAIIGAFVTGIGQVLVKRGQAKLTPLLDNLLATLIVSLILVPLLFIWGIDITAGKNILIYALIAAVMYASFYYIISFGNVSLMVSLINTFPVVTIALSISYLHESPSLYQWLGIAMVILGAICISQEKSVKGVINKNKSWVIWGLLGSLAIGIAEFVTKLATAKVDGFTFTFFVYLMYIPVFLIIMAFDRKGRKFKMLKNQSSLLFTAIGIFFIEAGLIAIALAYQHGLASLVSPVVATHMLITALLAVFLLKEQLLVIQRIGILLTLIGVSVIGIWS